MRVLLIEDDSATAQSIELMLKSESFNVYTTDLGEEGVDLGKLYDYDIILLDLNLPDMSGYEVLRTLRVAKVQTPILILSGLAGIEDKVRGLGFGADDYMTKPFHKDELVARIHAIVRRSKGHAQSVIQTGDLTVNLDTKTVEVMTQRVHLTGKEYQMLELLSLRKGTTLTKEMFLNHLYGGMDEPELKIIDVFICKLRKKLSVATGGKNYIETVWGRGYVLREPDENEITPKAPDFAPSSGKSLQWSDLRQEGHESCARMARPFPKRHVTQNPVQQCTGFWFVARCRTNPCPLPLERRARWRLRVDQSPPGPSVTLPHKNLAPVSKSPPPTRRVARSVPCAHQPEEIPMFNRLAAPLVAALALRPLPAFAQSEPKGDTVSVNGMEMYYEISGEGDPLIVLHGAYMNIPTMGEIIPMLAKTHQVIAVELQGHGRTTDIDRPITYPNLADDVAAFMDAIGVEKADIFGYSMGAAAGLQLAIRHPEKVDQLVAASVAYDASGWQPDFTAFLPSMTRRHVRRHADGRGIPQARRQSRRLPRASPKS